MRNTPQIIFIAINFFKILKFQCKIKFSYIKKAKNCN